MIYLRFVLLQPRRDYYAIGAELDRYYLIDQLIPSFGQPSECDSYLSNRSE